MYEITFNGEIGVGSQLYSRSNQTGFAIEVLSATRNILPIGDVQRLYLSCATNQDSILPDAQTLEVGWSKEIECAYDSTGSIILKTYDAVTPAILKTLAPEIAVKVHLLDNSTAAGVWSVDYITKTANVIADRYVFGFDATTSWGTASNGYYTIQLTSVTHGMGSNPTSKLQKTVNTSFKDTFPDGGGVTTNASGDISFRVPESPDLRFAGRLIVQ